MGERPPLLARWLVRLLPLGERRAEVNADLEELYRARLASGRTQASWRYARDVVSLARGGVTPPVRKPASRVTPAEFIGGVRRDFVYALRMFAHRPGVVGMTILGLGLAIGVSVSVFTLVNAVFLRSGGVSEAETIPRVMRAWPGGTSTHWQYSDFRHLQAAATRSTPVAWFSEQALFRRQSLAEQDPPDVTVALVSGGFFDIAGARGSSGRLLTAQDDRPGADPVAVVSHGFWTRQLRADPAIVGRTIFLGRGAVTIVGVAARDLTAPSETAPAFWVPFSAYHHMFGGKPLDAQSQVMVAIATRVKTGETLEAAEADFGAAASGIPPLSSGAPARLEARFDGSRPLGRPGSAETLAVVIGVAIAIGLVLLLACVNVATVLVAVATSRQREIGVRLALGASRGRVVRQLLTESVTLGVMGGAVGFAVAMWFVPVLARLTNAPPALDIAPDLNVFLFLTAVTLVSGIVAGLAPSRLGRRGDLSSPLKGASASQVGSGPHRLRSTLLGMQAAGSILLLVLAALLSGAAVRAARVDVGFDADRVVTASAGFDFSADPVPATAFWNSVLDRLQGVPELEAVSLSLHPPFMGLTHSRPDKEGGVTYYDFTRANYFEVLGLRTVRGRTYTAAEVASTAPVAVISESIARRYWGQEDPIGSPLQRADPGSKATVIGVVADTIPYRLRERNTFMIYQPLKPKDMAMAHLVARSRAESAAALRPIRQALLAEDPNRNVSMARVGDMLQAEVQDPRIMAMLASGLSVLAVVLAAIGLYGVTASVVGQRTREIGLRMAIGASRGEVIRMLLRDSLRPVIVGLIVGIGLAIAGSRAISGVLFGLSPYDPVSFGAAVAVLLATCTAAVIGPARRASRVDPADVLRQS